MTFDRASDASSAAARSPACTDIVLRDSLAGDVAAVQDIYASHVLHGTGSFEERAPDREEMAQRREVILAKGLPYIVAGYDQRILGFAYAAPFRPRPAYRFTIEDSIYIHPDAIGRGLGRLLLGDLIVRCEALGYRQMVAVIGDSRNARSIRLHEALGFNRAGTFTSVGFKFGRWLDAVLMQRALGESDSTLPEG
ncbi:MAG: N-acetyltransferase family protein [Hyphomicrobium sp.]